MRKIASAAAFLIIGLAIFHFYGVAFLLYHLCLGRSAEMPIFGIYGASDVPEFELMRGNAVAVGMLLVFALILVQLARGLRQLSLRAWALSTLICIGYAGVRLATAQGKTWVSPGVYYLVDYCVLTVVILLLSAPIFFKSGSKAADETV